MKRKNSSYRIIYVLLSLLFWPDGTCSVFGKAESMLITDSIPLTQQNVKNQPSDTLNIMNSDSLSTDSINFQNLKNEQMLNSAIDSAKLNQINDSLVQAVHRKKAAFVPNPQRALWLALMIPGAGQIYNRKYWKLPIFYGGFLGCVYALSWNGQMYSDYSQAYLDIMDDDPNTKSYVDMLPINYDIIGKEEQFKNIFKNKKNFYRRYRDMSVFAMIGVYLLSVVDAYVDAELSSFDISKDLSMKLEPTIINDSKNLNQTSVGLQCRFNF